MSADHQTPSVRSAAAPVEPVAVLTPPLWTTPAGSAWGVPADLGRRLIARAIDVALLLLLLAAIFVVSPPSRDGDGPGTRYQSLVVGWLVVVVLYEFVMVRLLGWTVGKRILGLRVVSIEGGKIGWLASAGRVYVPRIVDMCTFGIGGLLFALSPLFDDTPWRRGWHDRIASSVVIRSRGPLPTQPLDLVRLGPVAEAPVVPAGLLQDGAVVAALAVYGRRAMAGEDPWAAETMPLAPLRDGIPALQGRAEASRILDELLRVARLSPWHGVGVWRFVAAHGLTSWRKTALSSVFLDALRQLMADPAGPAIAYRFDAFEAELVEGREPPESPLRRLLPPASGDASA